LVGSAVGGAIAIRFAAREPRSVNALVAFSPACGLAADKRDHFVSMADRLQSVGPRGLRPPAGTPRFLFPPELRVENEAVEFHENFSLSNDPRSLAAWQRMLADLQMEDSFAALDCPALFVGATFDPLRPAAATRELALKARRGSYLELPTGHFAPWQTPDLVASTLKRFFHEQRTSGDAMNSDNRRGT
jgi:3-oxoadipate enol-lactonase